MHDILMVMQHSKSGTSVNYFTILLGELTQVVEQLLNMNIEFVLHVELTKKIILKFERARTDFMSKVLNNDNLQNVSQQEVKNLDLIFS